MGFNKPVSFPLLIYVIYLYNKEETKVIYPTKSFSYYKIIITYFIFNFKYFCNFFYLRVKKTANGV